MDGLDLAFDVITVEQRDRVRALEDQGQNHTHEIKSLEGERSALQTKVEELVREWGEVEERVEQLAE